MNKKGFTLIELLALIIIIGVIATISIIAVTDSISRSKDESVVELARNYSESARAMRNQDKLPYDPKKGEALIIPYSEINGIDISHNEVTGYGKILPSYCYVGIVNNNDKYSYYINQVDESYHLINRIEINSLTKDDVLSGIDDMSMNDIKEIKTPLNNFSIGLGNNNYNIKAIGVEYDANFVNDNSLFSTSFDLTKQGIKFKGVMKFYNYSASQSASKLELTITSNDLALLDNKTYLLKKKTNSTNRWIVANENATPVSVKGKPVEIVVQSKNNNGINFDFIIDNKTIYESVSSTIKAPLYGYFSKDNSYLLSSAKIKGSINEYDNYSLTGVFQSTGNKNITIDGVKYLVNGSKISYLVLKK